VNCKKKKQKAYIMSEKKSKDKTDLNDVKISEESLKEEQSKTNKTSDDNVINKKLKTPQKKAQFPDESYLLTTKIKLEGESENEDGGKDQGKDVKDQESQDDNKSIRTARSSKRTARSSKRSRSVPSGKKSEGGRSLNKKRSLSEICLDDDGMTAYGMDDVATIKTKTRSTKHTFMTRASQRSDDLSSISRGSITSGKTGRKKVKVKKVRNILKDETKNDEEENQQNQKRRVRKVKNPNEDVPVISVTKEDSKTSSPDLKVPTSSSLLEPNNTNNGVNKQNPRTFFSALSNVHLVMSTKLSNFMSADPEKKRKRRKNVAGSKTETEQNDGREQKFKIGEDGKEMVKIFKKKRKGGTRDGSFESIYIEPEDEDGPKAPKRGQIKTNRGRKTKKKEFDFVWLYTDFNFIPTFEERAGAIEKNEFQKKGIHVSPASLRVEPDIEKGEDDDDEIINHSTPIPDDPKYFIDFGLTIPQVRHILAKNVLCHRHVIRYRNQINVCAATFNKEVWVSILRFFLFSMAYLGICLVACVPMFTLKNMKHLSREDAINSIFQVSVWLKCLMFGGVLLWTISGGRGIIDYKVYPGYGKFLWDWGIGPAVAFPFSIMFMCGYLEEAFGLTYYIQYKVDIIIINIHIVLFSYMWAYMEVSCLFQFKAFHQFLQMTRIRLPTPRFMTGQVLLAGTFYGLLLTAVVNIAFLQHHLLPLINLSWGHAICTWLGLLFLKIGVDKLLVLYFCNTNNSYDVVELSEIALFCIDSNLTMFVRMCTKERSMYGAIFGNLMIVAIEGIIVMIDMFRAIKKIRGESRCPLKLKRNFKLKLTYLQSNSILNFVTPVITILQLYSMDYAGMKVKKDSEYIHDPFSVFIVLIGQIGPSFLIECLKFIVLRSFGFDLGAFWDNQWNLRTWIGKCGGAILSACVYEVAFLRRAYYLNDLIEVDNWLINKG